MELMNFVEIVKCVNGEVQKDSNYYNYISVSTDTRNITKDSIFIALKGENFNGNDYVIQASKGGASLCIVSEINFSLCDFRDNTSIILVKDTRIALLNLAEYYRTKLNIKVIGITGSTGKTSTKDILAASLSKKYKVFKTLGNFNNEIGLPLMLFNIDNSYDIAVLEMGMSDFNEIHKLVKVSRPNIAIITNIGISHLENLKTRENILAAKMEITDYFDSDCTLIVNGDNDLLCQLESNNYEILKIGIESSFYLTAKNILLKDNSIQFDLTENLNKIVSRFKLNIAGKHNILNAMLAIATCNKLNIDCKSIQEGLEEIEFTSRRLEVIIGKEFTILDDCYNASPDSMKAAIDVLINRKANRKIGIFGTMFELGEESSNAHKSVAEYAKLKGIDILIGLGEYSNDYNIGYDNYGDFKTFNTYKDAVNYTISIIKTNDVVLVKASRSMKFEQIVDMLKMHLDKRG